VSFCGLVTIAGAIPQLDGLSATLTNWVDHPAIRYGSTPANDPVARLIHRIDAGEVRLQLEGPSGYLRSLLAELHIPVESQIAVFSKDSLQQKRIEPTNPRAIYFNDAVAVGWVRTGIIEIASQDPRQGTVFYTFDEGSRLRRRDECRSCHFNVFTVGVPGMRMVSSGYSAEDHRVPIDKRWGGWYVTGFHGSMKHLGNVPLDELFGPSPPKNTSNWASLEGKFDTNGYLTHYSDIVALMVFEHQMHLMNLLTRIGWEARVADYRATHADAPDDEPYALDEAAREVVDYLLFIDEAPLTGQIRGTSGFAEGFAVQGPRDRAGRSLRDFDLRRRLMRYPCSYMIYADAFDRLPQAARDAIYARMWRILSGAEQDRRYRRLSSSDRKAIVEILRDTKQGLPDYFRTVSR
jgi:hypothetical protein